MSLTILFPHFAKKLCRVLKGVKKPQFADATPDYRSRGIEVKRRKALTVGRLHVTGTTGPE